MILLNDEIKNPQKTKVIGNLVVKTYNVTQYI
jgi:hypothetical protein